MASSEPLLAARGVSKAYPGVLALNRVDFELAAGEIHALMGENGAGKSTLIKVLTGAVQPSEGSMRLEGRAYAPHGAAAAQHQGVWAVHQEVSLLPNMTVSDNLFLGHQPRRYGLIDRRQMNELARRTLAELQLDLDVTRPLGSYPVAVRQLVAIARAARADARVLVLDEPTASLDEGEVKTLFELIRRLAERGTGIIFITHFLDQVYALSDRITVLRNGQLVGTKAAADLPRREMVSMMLGKALEESIARPVRAARKDAPILAKFTDMHRVGEVVRFDIELRPGEAVGAAGLLGSGRTETALLMFGAMPADGGAVTVDGRNVQIRSPSDAMELGFAFSPEDRKTDGILGSLSIRENIIVALQARNGWRRKVPRRMQEEIAERYISMLGIRTPDADKPIEQLSGGNQQKAILARWLATEPRLLILDEPTRGIDVGAHAEIVRLIEQLRDEGMALYVISSEIEELAAYSDRVSVMRDRKQVRMLEGDEVSFGAIVEAIAVPEEGAPR